ncbi:MAG TPA: GAF domain-containing protein, partial [Acidimicrobiia bacterium]|nr:GAF domain-containing protein [Acidimicrobiia bacterium]
LGDGPVRPAFGTVVRGTIAAPYRFRPGVEPETTAPDPESRPDPGSAADGGRARAEALLRSDLPDDAALQAVVEALAAAHPAWNWVGIYLLAGDTLVLGPFVGPPTEHVRIPVGAGVCGTAVAEDRNLVVDDVAELDNYLACSTGTRSEIVVLIRDGDDLVGQFDVDSDDIGAFSADDESLLSALAGLAGPRCRRLVQS